MFDHHDIAAMTRALLLAQRGEGHVEPNPMVGAVVTAPNNFGGHDVIGEGWHETFGGPHAEVRALQAAGSRSRGATLFVTLEPCCNHGKTPPCTDAVIQSGVDRVVIATLDPFPAVQGKGVTQLKKAGITVNLGLLEQKALQLTRSFRTLVKDGRPWVIAKWAMSLDGVLATGSQEDRWLSTEESRKLVHELRGRVDGILVGIRTALIDDPLLTPRPRGPRLPLRIVLDNQARLPLSSQLVQTSHEAPVFVATGPNASSDRIDALRRAGCEVWVAPTVEKQDQLSALLLELGRRKHTHLLVEGGPQVLESFFDARFVDEVWTFIAPRIIGRRDQEHSDLPTFINAPPMHIEHIEHPGGDILLKGCINA